MRVTYFPCRLSFSLLLYFIYLLVSVFSAAASGAGFVSIFRSDSGDIFICLQLTRQSFTSLPVSVWNTSSNLRDGSLIFFLHKLLQWIKTRPARKLTQSEKWEVWASKAALLRFTGNHWATAAVSVEWMSQHLMEQIDEIRVDNVLFLFHGNDIWQSSL